VFIESRLERLVQQVRNTAAIPLRLQLWNGHRFDLSSHPTVIITIPKASALRYFISPDLNKLGEAFVEGHIRVEGPIHEIFRVGEALACNAVASTRAGLMGFFSHGRKRDRKSIEYHYDVSNDFYSLFLDRNMVYSCAYFKGESDSLDQAQVQKLDHILNKLMLREGEQFLDIGCGWGALIIRAASQYGARATGITLSRNQYEYARARIEAEGLQDRCKVELMDYRDLPDAGTYDKIASVGMFEHVGLRNLPLYFRKIRLALKEGGLLLNHGITATDPESRWVAKGAGEFIDRYVFPNGELPHLSLIVHKMAEEGLEATDIESLRRHYARTCHIWASRLEGNRERAAASAGDRRQRIWEVYLAGCAYGFEKGWMNIYQILARKADAVENPLPLTRDYMYAE
jgi:cyclopropane-fatty-acyl-phospholipid synthase